LSLKADLRLWKDAVKCVWFGAKARDLPPFEGWVDTIVLGETVQSGLSIPSIAWLFWNSEDKPALVRATINRVKRLNPDVEVRLLDQKNVGQYINADFLERDDITLSHKSDIVRLELLSAYGGIWLDATCIFNESFSWVYQAFDQHASDLIAFYRDAETTDHRYPIIESWFLACAPKNKYIVAWRDEFKKVLNNGSAGYFKNLSAMEVYPDLKQGINRPEYLIVYLAQQLVTRNLNPSLYLRKAEAAPFFYQQISKWDRVKIATLLCRMSAPTITPPVIKLTHSNRYLMPLLIKTRLVKRNSIVGKFIKE
jgi:hypothetical protein